MPHLWTALVITVHAAGIVSAVRAVMDTRTPQGAVAWAAVLIMLPWVGLPAYWVLGRSKFEGYILRRRRHYETSDPVARELFTELRARALLADPGHEKARLVEALAKLPFTAGNMAELLLKAETVFGSIFDGIRQAREYILIEFYIVCSDAIGSKLQQHLLDALARGVRVHMIYDEVGSYWLSSAYVDTLRKAGAEIYSFHTRRGWINRWQFNFRNHRKIVVIDGETAWVGGYNVTDDGFGRNPELGRWRDTHVKLQGPVVPCVQLGFL